MSDTLQNTRRELLRNTLLGAAGLPLLLPQRVMGANDRIRVGVIGVGGRGNLLIDQLPEQAEVVAVADCNYSRCEEAATKRQAKWKLHRDYRKLLEQNDVDAVVISTTDHGRVLPCIHACQAGKDVYAEKPLTLYIGEGRTLVKAARKYKRIFQVGSQQRSMETNRIASEFVRSGGLGGKTVVKGVNYTGPARFTETTEQPVPQGLDWDMWLGQAPMRPYHSDLHKRWMSWVDYSGGQMTNWGAHGLDQIQCALGTDQTGPVELYPLEDGPAGSVGFRYENGATVRLELPEGPLMSGATFIGSNGSVTITRNAFETDPPGLIKTVPRAEEVEKWKEKYARWQAKWHMEAWLNCMRTRETPNADVEIGHRSISLSHLANITRQLNRKLRWDPKAEQFRDDDEANKLVNRPRRKGYELPKV